MMKRWQKMLVGISVSILFFVLCVGYAAVNDDLNIFGFLNMEGQNKAVLVAGPEFNEALQVCDGVKTVIFDTFTNQSTAMQSMNMEWEAGTAVDEEAKGDIRLFYHAASSTAYILIQTDGDILANPDASGMFENIATLETIWFNRFSTKATTEFDSMFAGCGSLKTIYAATDFEVTALVSADNMFTECYILTGGKGTRVYPLGATATDQPLDATNAKIDAVGTPGYFTNVSQLRLTYFHSNLLKETSAEYSVKGSSVEITLSNGLDSTAYSKDAVHYQLVCYVLEGDDWTYLSTVEGSIPGGSYNTVTETVSVPSSHNRIKVVANCLSGQMGSLEAVFTFDTAPHSATWRLEDGVIYLQLSTGSEGGQYAFTWDSGITADQSDPNGIFTAVASGATAHTAQLQSWSSYEFCFFITDKELWNTLNTGNIQDYVTFTHP